MKSDDRNLAQLRHAYHLMTHGQNGAGAGVLASVIRDMERRKSDGK